MESTDITKVSSEDLLKIFYNSDITIANLQGELQNAHATKQAITNEMNRREQVAKDIKENVEKATAKATAEASDDTPPPAPKK